MVESIAPGPSLRGVRFRKSRSGSPFSQRIHCTSIHNNITLPINPASTAARPAKLSLQILPPPETFPIESTAQYPNVDNVRFVSHHCRQPFETCTSPVQQLERLVHGLSCGQLMPQRKASPSCQPGGRSPKAVASGWQFAVLSTLDGVHDGWLASGLT